MSSRCFGMAMFGRNQALYVTELLADSGLIGQEACEIRPTQQVDKQTFPRPEPRFHTEALKEQWGERTLKVRANECQKQTDQKKSLGKYHLKA